MCPLALRCSLNRLFVVKSTPFPWFWTVLLALLIDWRVGRIDPAPGRIDLPIRRIDSRKSRLHSLPRRIDFPRSRIDSQARRLDPNARRIDKALGRFDSSFGRLEPLKSRIDSCPSRLQREPSRSGLRIRRSGLQDGRLQSKAVQLPPQAIRPRAPPVGTSRHRAPRQGLSPRVEYTSAGVQPESGRDEFRLICSHHLPLHALHLREIKPRKSS
jgi:hypothetical protein